MKTRFSILFLLHLLLPASCGPAKSAHNLNNSSSASIIGGQIAVASQFPFVVNIWLNSPEDLFVGHLCGASLVHPHWVLTAAHCVLQDVADKSQGTLKLKELTLFLGSPAADGKGAQGLKAKRILVHPEFLWPRYDVALIELAEDVTNVLPVNLNSKPVVIGSPAPMATVAGWGLIDELGKIDSPVLRQVDLPLVSRQQCLQDAYVQKQKWEIGPETLCAQTLLGKKASCDGDSGGPLFQNVDGVFLQIGIVSWGSACNIAYQGRQADVEGYSDVSAAYPWIQSQIGLSNKIK